MIAALAFLLVTGALTLVLITVLGRGLFKAWGDRKALQAQARERGWRYLGSGTFTAAAGDNDWRADCGSDSDNGRTWTEFRGSVAGLEPGGFVILDQRLDKPPSGRPVPGDWVVVSDEATAFGRSARCVASGPEWLGVLGPEVEALWMAHRQLAPWPLSVMGRGHVVHLYRDDDGHEATKAQTLALIALGEAILARARVLAATSG